MQTSTPAFEPICSGVTGPKIAIQSEIQPPINHKPRKHIRALDGIRGVAILFVFFIHYGNLSQFHSGILRYVDNVKSAGWIGVDIFFALSGFLITGVLWNSRGRAHGWRNFYIRRALRLLPVFYVVWIPLALYGLVQHVWRPEHWMYVIHAGNFVAPVVSELGVFRVSHFWSLAVEEQYYLLWPFVVWRVATVRSYAFILGGALAISVLLKAFILLNFHAAPTFIYVLLPTHVEGLLLGSFAAILTKMRPSWNLSSVSKVALPASGLLLLAIGLAEGRLDYYDPLVQFLGYPALAVFSVALIILALDQCSIFSRILSGRILVRLGQISYGFYVYHFLLHDVLRKYLYPRLSFFSHNQVLIGVVYLGICFSLCVAISFISFRYMESPLLKLKDRFASA